MNAAKIISVNPSKKTLGEFNLNLESMERVSRSFSNPGSNLILSYKKTVNFLSGISSRTSMSFSRNILMLRLVAGSLLLAGVAHGISPLLFSIMAVSLIFGIFTRITTFAGGVTFIAAFIMALSTGNQGILYLMASIALFSFSYFGPGRISFDRILRKKIYKSIAQDNKKENSDNYAMDYRAYSKLGR